MTVRRLIEVEGVGLHTVVDETEEQDDLAIGVNGKGVWLGCRQFLS
jgi:hypothetical protein